MNSSWQEFLGTSGAHIDNGMVTDFGDLATELVSACNETIIAPLAHLGLLECTGEDSRTFLQNQFTSDINHLVSGSAQHSSWCTAKGRMQASFLLFRNSQDYRALLSLDLLAATQQGLQKYVLRSKVKISDISANYEIIGLSGPQAEAALNGSGLPIPEKNLETVDASGTTIIRLNASRFVIVAAGDAVAGLWKSLAVKARPVGVPVWHWLDIQDGLPLITEATKEAFVPQMVNFDKIGGVSFRKGCYPGQEIVARTQYLGKIKRHLYRIHAVSPILPGMSIYSPDSQEHPCGMVVNAAPSPMGGYDALAVIQENYIEAGNFGLGTPNGQSFVINPVVA